ncbi:MAG: PIN domain-containing protein [Acidobacteriota bacterium]
MNRSVLLDTVFIQALLNRRDQYHEQAKAIFPQVRRVARVWVTEAVLVEVGNACSTLDREAAAAFIRQCYRTENIRVVSVDTPLMRESLALYAARPDKGWGLTDCISFVAMRRHSVEAAVTADQHFVQAGFQILMSDEG